MIRNARAAGMTRAATVFVVFPGSGGVARQIEHPDSRLGGESIAEVFRAVGGEIRQSWCGPCFGRGPDALQPASAQSPRSTVTGRIGWVWAGRLSPSLVVAASALAGYMAPPSELGLKWDAETYGV